MITPEDPYVINEETKTQKLNPDLLPYEVDCNRDV